MYKQLARSILLMLLWMFGLDVAMSQTVVMSEDFESGALPAGWTEINTSVPAIDWQYQDGGFDYSSPSFEYEKTPPNAHSGSFNAVFHSGNSSESMLVTPHYDFSGGKVAKLEYWHTQGCYYNQALNVYFREGKNGPWNLLKSNSDVVFNWSKDSLIIPSVSDSVFIGFQGIWDGGCGVCLDDVTLYSLSPYNVVFTVTDIDGVPVKGSIITFNGVSKLSDDNGIALFTQVYEGLGYNYEVRKNGYSPKAGKTDVTTNETVDVIIQPSRIIYVAPTPATLGYNGKTWDSAYVNLEDALTDAKAGDQVWIAEGVYYPTKQWNVSSPRAYSFSLESEVAIFGGFPGVPGQERDLSVRDIDTYKTVLSGDVDRNDITDASGISTSIVGDNSFFVVFNNNNSLDNTSILNGVYITGGSSTIGAYRWGAAIYNQFSSPTLTHCRIQGNSASGGGVVYNNGASPQFFNCHFSNNVGSGMQNNSAPVVIEDCMFNENTVNGLYNNFSDMSIERTLFNGNGQHGILNESSVTSFDQCEFNDNGQNGLYCLFGANTDIDSCVFNGNGQYGFIADNSSATILASSFNQNTVSAILSQDLSGTEEINVQNCQFFNNGNGTANGGAVSVNGLNKSILYNLIFQKNNGDLGGAVYVEGTSICKLTNAEFWSNSANSGAGLYFKDCSPTVYHITAERNSSTTTGGFVVADNASVDIQNAIMWNNEENGSSNHVSEINGGNVSLNFATVEGGFVSGTNITTDNPLFLDAEYGLLRHKGHSPVIDLGIDLSVGEDVLHFARPTGSGVDLGAYERGAGIDVIGGFPIDNEQVVGTFKTFKLVFTENINKGASGTISLYYDEDNSLVQAFDILTDVIISGDTAIFTASEELAFGDFHIEISKDAFTGAVSGLGFYGTVSPRELNFEIFREQVYVNPLAGGVENGWDWHNAMLDFQDAMDIAVPGQEIWLSAGTFKPSVEVGGSGNRYQAFVLQNDNHVYGGFSGVPGTEGDLASRNTNKYPTVFSGDHSGNDDGSDANYSDNSYHIIYNNGANGDDLDSAFVISGITFTGGSDVTGAGTQHGSAIYVASSSFQVDSCRFISNDASQSVVYIRSLADADTLKISNSQFVSNQGSNVIYGDDSNVKLDQCDFINNEAVTVFSFQADYYVNGLKFHDNNSDRLIELADGTIEAQNILMHSNTGTSAFTLSSVAAVIDHITIAGNTFSGTTFSYASSAVRLRNSILWENSSEEISTEGNVWNIEYNIVSGGYANGSDILDVDPLFYDPANNIYTLTQCSPGINAGSDFGSTQDINGVLRPVGGAVDMGVYERNDGPCLVASDPADEYFGGRQETFTLTFSENIQKQSGNIYIYTKDENTLVETVDLADATVSGTDLEFDVSSSVSFDEFYLLIDSSAIVSSTDVNRVFDGIISDTVINFTFHNTVKYVDIDATGANNGFDWANAFNNLQDAIDASIAGDFIWVAEGTYLPTTLRDGGDARSASFLLKDSVQIFGGFSALDDVFANRDPEAFATVLSGDLDSDDVETSDSYTANGNNAYHVIYSYYQFLSSETVLNGFFFKGGYADGTGSDVNGGAILMSFTDTLVVDKCTFKGNYAAGSGGAYSSNVPISVSNSSFLYNRADDYGGAIFVTDKCEIKSCSFVGNTSGTSGGAIIITDNKGGESTISHSVFSSNSSAHGSALYVAWGDYPVVIHNVLAHNNAIASATTSLGEGTLTFNGVEFKCVNVTVTDNRGVATAGIFSTTNKNGTIQNCILWNNIGGIGQDNIANEGSGALTVENSIVGDDAEDDGTVFTGVGNLDLDPRFVDPSIGNFNLQSCSPAIEAGNNSYIETISSNDYVGNVRVFDGNGDGTATVDIGAIESLGNCETSDCPVTYDACWTGCLSTNWFDASNWNTGLIPTASENVYIPGNTVVCNQPLIIGKSADCKTITIDTDDSAQVTIDVDNGGKLQMGL